MATPRKSLGLLVSVLALLAVVLTGFLALRFSENRPLTDDAYLQAYIVNMAPDVSGRIVQLDVHDNQRVKKDQILFVIDPEPYRLRTDQARAEVQALEARLAVASDQVASQTSKADVAASGVNTAESQRALAASTLARLEPLLSSGF